MINYKMKARVFQAGVFQAQKVDSIKKAYDEALLEAHKMNERYKFKSKFNLQNDNNTVESSSYFIRNKNTQKYCRCTDKGIVCDKESANSSDRQFMIKREGHDYYTLYSPFLRKYCAPHSYYEDTIIDCIYVPKMDDRDGVELKPTSETFFHLNHIKDKEYTIKHRDSGLFWTDSGEGGIISHPSGLNGNNAQTFELIKSDENR